VVDAKAGLGCYRGLGVQRDAGFCESTRHAPRGLSRLKAEPLQGIAGWLEPFRQFWSAHVDALERHLDRLHPATPASNKTRKRK